MKTKKNKIVIYLSLLIIFRVTSAFSQYSGGLNSGASQNSQIQAVCTLSAIGFTGGIEDGHSSSLFTQTVCTLAPTGFTGGIEDGHSSSLFTQTVCTLAPTGFTGGIEDGHSSNTLTQTVCVPSIAAYTGGIEDGTAVKRYSVCLDVLPIELLTFTATLNGDKVDLVWETASETNNDYFTVEKTQDGNFYEKAAVVDGAGNSTHNLNYKTLDPNPYTGLSYYRLKQTDFDGNFKYSDLAPIDYTKNNFSLYPNPLAGDQELTLKYSSRGESASQLNIVIRDVVGKLVLQKSLETNEGLNTFNIGIPGVSNGIYFVQINVSSGKEQTIKLIINK